jgi:hypothetical protein
MIRSGPRCLTLQRPCLFGQWLLGNYCITFDNMIHILLVHDTAQEDIYFSHPHTGKIISITRKALEKLA